jgi:MFS transporter, Spinster family, sphingosine-1-phosphate transporter
MSAERSALSAEGSRDGSDQGGVNLAAERMARRALAVLTFINLFNYVDRLIVPPLVESLRASELHLNDVQAGLLGSGFIMVYMATSPVFGMLGDRGKRTGLIALGVGIWSLATTLGGFARSFLALFFARASVGIGEAAYGTIAPSLLADYFPKKKRGRVFAVFFAAIPIGSALGYVIGGLVDQHFGWRAAFFIAGAPGLLLAFLILGLREPERGAQDEADDPRVASVSKAAGWVSYRRLLSNRPYLLTVLGYAAYTFALGGLAFWMPTFLERVRGVSKAAATVQFGGIVVATGFVGTFAGGWIGDYFLPRARHAYLLVSGIATLVAVPFCIGALVSPTPSVYLTSLVIAELLIFASTGPINSAIVNYVAPTERASAVALSIFGIHFLGDVPSPTLIGWISKASSLDRAVLVVPVAVLIGGIIWTYGALRREAS